MMDSSSAATLRCGTTIAAALYVVSGVTQPLLMTVANDAGLADRSCQLYMLFYYLGPALVVFSLLPPFASSQNRKDAGHELHHSPSWSTLTKSGSIAAIDIVAQSLNYTGSIMAGPTFFAIIYSSVTVWTAVYSRFVLSRKMSMFQWLGILVVFSGLGITALHSVSVGPGVFYGSCFVFAGSSMHALTYVLSEAIMTRGERLSIRANCATQGIVACTAYLLWQIFYTLPKFDLLITGPMQKAGTTWIDASIVLLSIAAANLLHAVTFFHTLANFPTGATSAGVMKGLQAVLVFVVTSWAFCGRTGGEEMCFNGEKLISLIVVICGVLIYAKATEVRSRREDRNGNRGGYTKLDDVINTTEDPV